jgi:hypothetical protein
MKDKKGNVKVFGVLLFCMSILFYSCSRENDILPDKNDFAELKSALSSIDSVEIADPIEQIEVDSMRFAEYMKFKKNRELLEIQSMFSEERKLSGQIKSASAIASYYVESTISDNIYAIRDLPVTIRTKSGTSISTNGKGRELAVNAGRGGRQSAEIEEQAYPYAGSGRPSRPSYTNKFKFYFKTFPASSGIPYILYSKQENTPVSVGTYSKDPDNPVLYTRDNSSGSLYMASFDFLPSNTKRYVKWQSNGLIAQGNSGNWSDIYYKVAEVRNYNKTGVSKWNGSSTQECSITPGATFTVDDIEFSNSYNTRIVNQGSIKVSGGEQNDFNNTYLPNVNVKFYKDVEDKSRFEEHSCIAFSLKTDGKKFPLPTIINGAINTWPSQSTPRVALYEEKQQIIPKQLQGFIATSLDPRTKMEAIYTYRWYDVEVDYSVKISYSNRSDVRRTTLKGIWKGRIWIDPKEPVLYKFINLNNNQVIEQGEIDISNVDYSKAPAFIKMKSSKH